MKLAISDTQPNQQRPIPNAGAAILSAKPDNTDLNQPISSSTRQSVTANDDLDSRKVPYRSHWQQNAFKELHTLLAGGLLNPHTIPQSFAEEQQIVDPLSPQGISFQNGMEALTKRLLPNLDLSKHPITFVLGDSAEKNAFIVTTPQQSLICFDLAILKSFNNLDQLSWVLLHELTHLEYRGLWGNIPNTQTEEAICDLRPLVALFEAGLNPSESESYVYKMADTKPPPWVTLVDAHGLPAFRLGGIQQALVLLRDRRGELKDGSDPLPAKLDPQRHLLDARHESYVVRMLNRHDYSSKDTLGKLKILHSLLPELHPQFPRRMERFGKELQKITVSSDDKEERQILIAMMESLIDNPPAFNMLHGRLRSILDGKNPAKVRYYAPRLLELAKAAKAFIKSEDKSKSEKEAAAKTLVDRLESLPAWQSLAWSTVGLPSFELATAETYKKAIKRFGKTGEEEVIFPWEELADDAGPENHIARALLYLGTWDERIPLRAGLQDLAWMRKHLEASCKTFSTEEVMYSPVISTPRDSEQDIGRQDLKTDGNGRIISVGLPNGIYDDSLMLTTLSAVQDALDRHKLSIESDLRSATSVSTNSSTSSTQPTLSFLNIPYHEFIKNPYEHLRINQSLLSPQIESLSSSSQELLDEVFHRAAVQTGRSARELLQYFDGMLSVTTEPARTTYHNFIKGFFLTDSTSVNFATLQKNKMDRDNGSTTMQSYLDWIAIDKHQLFTLQEKGKILQGSSGLPASFNRKIVGIEKPKSSDDLVKAIDLYWQLGRVTDGSLVVTDTDIIVSEAISSELEDFFLEEPQIPQLWRLLVSHGELLPHIVRSSQFDATLLRYLRTETEWPENPVTLCSIYRAADALSLFPDEGWRAQFTNLVMQRIDHTEDPHTRIAALEKLLLGAPLKDVDMREGATSRWVECIVNLFGPDDTPSWQSPDCSYLERLQPVLDRIANKGHPTIRESLLRNLGNTIVAQRQVSHALEKAALGSIDETSALGVGQAYGGLQTILTILGSEEAARLETITFLIRPLSPKALAKFAKDAARQAFDNAALFGSEHLVDADSNHYHERLKLECKRFCDNFWQAPMAYRAILLQDLLMPAQNRLDDFKAGARTSLDQALQFAISELLPLEDAQSNPNKYAAEAQRLLKAFLAPGVLDHRQQPVFLSALMAAAQRSNYEGNRLSVGQRLGTIFDSMGPAWKKFGQAIASHPNTPYDIAHDMEPLKGKRSTSRSEAWALYEETVPQTIRLQNPRLGPVLESASFFTAVDAGDDVFTLLTPNALARAEDGFSIMESFVAELRKANDEFSQIAQPVSEMVRSARTSAALETNGRVGAAQAEAMRQRYEGLVVHIGNEKYPVSTAIWRDHGPEFRRMQKMKGPTFNDLPSKAPEESLHKRKIAKAILYVELRNILSGGAFCVDRHGRNMRIDGNSIGHFDHGAVHAIVRDKSGHEVTPLAAEEALRDGGSVEITEATEAERLQLADALYSSFEQLSGKQPLAVVMHNEIEKARATTGKTPEYLIRVERALLALNDCFKCLDPEGHDIKDILASLYLNGEIDRTICTALEKRIRREKLGTFGMFAKVTGLIRQQLDSMIKERVTTSQNAPSTSPASRWHDYKQKRRDYPSLLTTKDFAPRRRPDADDPTNS